MCESHLATEREKEARNVFDALYLAWRRACTDGLDPATSPERVKELENSDLEMDLARQILAAPVPWCWMMSRRLEVMAHYIDTSGPLDALER